MNFTSDRIRSIGWISVLAICGAMTLGLTLRVNAVKSQVHDTERHIVAVQQDIDFLQTEFATRSNQQALRELNDLEFGYKAPLAGQYVEGERQLAALGVAAGPGAPAPIRYANADKQGEGTGSQSAGGSLLAMVSPVAGATAAALSDAPSGMTKGRDPEREALVHDAAALSKHLAHIEVAEAVQP